MKRTTKILIGIGVLGGLVGANLWYRKSKATKAAEVSAVPTTTTTTTDAPATTSTAKKTPPTKWRSFKAVNQFPQTFRNRVFTKVQDFHGVKVSAWDKSKTMALYQRIAMKLEAKGIALEKATLGQIGLVLKQIGADGFPFKTKMLPPNLTAEARRALNDRRSNNDREDWA